MREPQERLAALQRDLTGHTAQYEMIAAQINDVAKVRCRPSHRVISPHPTTLPRLTPAHPTALSRPIPLRCRAPTTTLSRPIPPRWLAPSHRVVRVVLNPIPPCCPTQRYSPEAILSRLEADVRKWTDEEKRLRTAFLGGQVDADTFVKQYTEASVQAKRASDRFARLNSPGERHRLGRLVVQGVFPRLDSV